MREGWVHKKLLDECSILYGYPFDSKCFSTSNEDMPLIRIRDVKEGKTTTFYKGEYPKEYIIHKGDYLIGMDGEFNISPWQSEDALLNQRVCMISCKTPSLLMRFVYRFLIKELKKIEDETPFVTVKHLSAKRLNQINIPVPPLSEQQRIVSELDLLTSIINKQKAQLKELDSLAQSIFYDMFGDPIENPKGWEVKTVGELSSEMRYGTSRPACEEGKYKYLRMGNLTNEGYLNLEDLKKINIPDNEIEKCIVRKGDVLFNRTNSLELIGKTCLFDFDEPMVIAGYLIRVRFKESIVPIYFTRLFNLSEIKRNYVLWQKEQLIKPILMQKN